MLRVLGIDHRDALLIILILPLRRKGAILIRCLSDHLENPEHHPRVMGCDTLTPKDTMFSNNLSFDCTTFV